MSCFAGPARSSSTIPCAKSGANLSTASRVSVTTWSASPFLRNTLGMTIPDVDWDVIWPLFVVALGAGVLWRAITTGNGAGQPH